MKNAAVENIIIWIIIFASFVTVFFMVINFSTVLRIKDHVDSLAEYGANYVATRGIGDDITIIMNDIAPPAILPMNVDTSDICDSVADNTFQVIFNIRTTNNSYLFHDGPITGTRVVFNQMNSNTITCDLSITVK